MDQSRGQDVRDRDARKRALGARNLPDGSNLPPIAYRSNGRLLILGPEHRVRHAANRLQGPLEPCGLITEPLPERLTPEMEACVGLASDVPLVSAPLLSLDGYLGRYDVQVRIDGESKSLAALIFKSEFFDAVLDLGERPRIERELDPPGYFHPDSEAELDASVDALSALRGEFEKPRYFQINASICAHSGSQMSGCTRCLYACPADAIRSVDHEIRVDAHLCHGAGGCATACPTGAIRYNAPDPLDLHDALGRLLDAYFDAGGEAPRLLLHDASDGAHWWAAHGEQLPGRWLPLQVEELGAAGLDLWLQALARGAEEVALLATENVTGTVVRVLERELVIAERLCEALGHGHRIRLVPAEQFQASGNGMAVASRPLMQGRVAVYQKRQLISEAVSHLHRHRGGKCSTTEVALPAGAAFGDVAIDDTGCTLCFSCVSICPTKALKSGGERPELSFTEDRCVQCGLCVSACPETVLELRPRYQLDPQLRTMPRVLKKEEPFHCIRCNKAFTTYSMVSRMEAKLAGHRMFAGAAIERLKMCGDCRVIDQALNDPDSGLIGLARGEGPESIMGRKPS